MTAAELFDRAIACYRDGRTDQVEVLCAEVVALEPRHADALYVLGVAALRAAKHESAVHWFERAVAERPQNPEFLANLGEAYRRVDRIDSAVAALSRALELKPTRGEAWFNLALAERKRGDAGRALSCLERAAELLPSTFQVRRELGLALAGRGELERAIEHLTHAARLNPGSAETRLDLGTALMLAGRLEAALEAQRAAVERAPNFALAHNNLGVTLGNLHRFDEALASLRRALELDPDMAEAHNNLAGALNRTGQVAEGVEAYRRSLALAPGQVNVHSNLVYSLSFHPDADDAATLREARGWRERHVARVEACVDHENDRSPERRLRIGYVSSDFREHVQALYMLPLLREHDRGAVEVFGYSNALAPDATTARHSALTDHFHNIVALDDAAAARLIRSHQIDVLVDLTMHMANSRLPLFARRPAPVQVSWLAYPGTTGLEAIDYRLSDPHIDPPDVALGCYAERTLRLPETFWCIDSLTTGSAVGPLPALRNGHLTLGCLNNFAKTHRGVFELWARVLDAVKDSRLILAVPAGSARERCQAIFERHGVGAERLEFVDFKPRADYLRLYDRIDLCLDTFPYGGHTTSLDSWWMGVPVLTLPGATVASRAGRSYAMNLGLPRWIAESPVQYVERACELASRPAELSELRAGLRERMTASPLMDTPRFARHLEAAYRQIWRAHCERP